MQYDLEERTFQFSRSILTFCSKLKQNTLTQPLINQLIRSATSIGANYAEANGASSKKDFKNKIHLCLKEAKETKYWLRLLQNADMAKTDNCSKLHREAEELTLIFSHICHKL